MIDHIERIDREAWNYQSGQLSLAFEWWWSEWCLQSFFSWEGSNNVCSFLHFYFFCVFVFDRVATCWIIACFRNHCGREHFCSSLLFYSFYFSSSTLKRCLLHTRFNNPFSIDQSWIWIYHQQSTNYKRGKITRACTARPLDSRYQKKKRKIVACADCFSGKDSWT